VLEPKVYGTMILFDLVKDARLDFLVLFSSITSVITPYAESDYSAANAFLDAFTHFANARTKFHTLTINWPGWKEVGQLADLKIRPGLEGWKEAALAKAIRTADGLEALKRALNSDLRQVIVSPEDLDELLKQSRSPFDHEKYLSPIQEEPRSSDVRTDGEKPGKQPADQVETRLAGIWKSVFGFEHIGLQDNFSQLGGHSLLAMQIVAKMRSSYHIDFTLREFFEAPTIAESSAVVRSRMAAGGESAPREQAPTALSPMGQRFFSAARSQTPCFLGQGNRRIFAIHHPPAGRGGHVLTVICPPLFNEYMRTQLALRELAVSLSDKGQHVLRFDYRGTGDSFGDLADVAISDWLEDVALAVQEGCKLSGSGVVQLLGVRAGSLLACRAAVASDGVERLVLWDPVTDGATYLQSMRRTQTTIIERNLSLSPAERCDTEREYAGHVLSDAMVDDLGSLDATAYATVSKRKLHVVCTSADARFPVEGVALEVAPFACNWETDLENLMMPKPVLERLGTCLTMS